MMEGIGWSVLTVLAWGIWLVPTQRCRTTDHLLIAVYVTLGNLLAAIVVATMVGAGELRLRTSIHPFLGGIVWAVSGWCAFAAVRQLGTAKAMGIWSPLNIVVSMLWGAVLFSEFANSTTDALLVTAAATGLMVAGIVTIISAGSNASAEASERGRMRWLGLLPALGAGLLWGSYFIPIRVAEVSLWVAALPMAMGMFVGSTVGAALMRRTLRPVAWADLPRLMLAGVLWAAGNYGSLRMMEQLGTGKGFTIAQLCVALNAVVGIYWLRRPSPGTPAARWTLIGVVIATSGAVLLGTLK